MRQCSQTTMSRLDCLETVDANRQHVERELERAEAGRCARDDDGRVVKYIGVFLDDRSRSLLLEWFPPVLPQVICHHVTLVYRPTQHAADTLFRASVYVCVCMCAYMCAAKMAAVYQASAI